MRDIDKISIEELADIADDESVKVPESLGVEVKSTLDMLSFMESLSSDNEFDELLRKRRQKRIFNVASLAASLALLVGVGFGVNSYMSRPKDTFTDPDMAYAELEQAFKLISLKVEKGADIARNAEVVMDKTNEILENIN